MGPLPHFRPLPVNTFIKIYDNDAGYEIVDDGTTTHQASNSNLVLVIGPLRLTEWQYKEFGRAAKRKLPALQRLLEAAPGRLDVVLYGNPGCPVNEAQPKRLVAAEVIDAAFAKVVRVYAEAVPQVRAALSLGLAD